VFVAPRIPTPSGYVTPEDETRDDQTGGQESDYAPFLCPFNFEEIHSFSLTSQMLLLPRIHVTTGGLSSWLCYLVKPEAVLSRLSEVLCRAISFRLCLFSCPWNARVL
jgi:hypothetical protein